MAEENFKLFTSLRYDVALLQVPKKSWAHAGWNSKNDSPLYMLDFHRDRMLKAATYWDWKPAIDAIAGDEGLTRLVHETQAFLDSTHKSSDPKRIRVFLSRDGDISHMLYETPPVALENLFPARLPPPGERNGEDEGDKDPRRMPVTEVVIDQEETGRSAYTHYKTTNRAMYDAARQRANIAPTDFKEVLIVNTDDGAIMEGSTTTPYFWRSGRWVTPPVPGRFSRVEGSGGNDGTTRRYALERGLAAEEAIRAETLVHGEECWLSNGVKGFMCGRVSLRRADDISRE